MKGECGIVGEIMSYQTYGVEYGNWTVEGYTCGGDGQWNVNIWRVAIWPVFWFIKVELNKIDMGRR